MSHSDDVLSNGEGCSSDVLTPCAYRVGSHLAPLGFRIEEVPQINGPTLWAGRYQGHCLSKEGFMEYEPLPSSRTDEFYALCRFESPEAVLEALKLYRKNKTQG